MSIFELHDYVWINVALSTSQFMRENKRQREIM